MDSNLKTAITVLVLAGTLALVAVACDIIEPIPTPGPTATDDFSITATAAARAGKCPPNTAVRIKPTGLISKLVMAITLKGDEADIPGGEFLAPETFHAVVRVANAPANTKFKGVWYALEVEKLALPCNTRLGETSEVVVEGSRNIVWSLPPKGSWPLGTYRLEVFVNGHLDHVVNFFVKTERQVR